MIKFVRICLHILKIQKEVQLRFLLLEKVIKNSTLNVTSIHLKQSNICIMS
jgi:hypothetical protein